jgi:hypothetical protein
MHAKGFLHKLLGSSIHSSRIKALSEVVTATIHTKKLQLTSIGRAIDLPIQERSGIQKVNRLLKNKHLLLERAFIASKVAGLLIGGKKRPEIIVDWSKYPNSKDGVMRASLSVEGRAITIYEERWLFKWMGRIKRQKKFLDGLKKVLADDCEPIIVTDAGFYNDWFKYVLKLGWHFVGRIRNVKKYRPHKDAPFKPCKILFKQATTTPKSLGEMQLTEGNPLLCHFYLVKLPPKKRKALMKNGKIKRDKDSKAYSRSYREPWLIVSSIKGATAAKKVIGIYKKRMTIEEAFRDLKSSKYGLSLEQGTTKKKNRRDILLLVAMIAGLIAWLIGKVGEEKQLHLQFQSNSIKKRRVLSFFYLGCQMVRKKINITLSELWKAATSLRNEVVNA